MNGQAVIGVLAALSMGVAGAAFGQSDKDMRADQAGRRGPQNTAAARPDRNGPGRGPDDHGGRGFDHGGPPHDDRGRARFEDRRGPPPGYRYAERDARGGGPDHHFYRGQRLPVEYRSRQYIVDDWRGHRLSAPPRGYQWVQTGGDYVLIAIATGIIASVLLNQ